MADISSNIGIPNNSADPPDCLNRPVSILIVVVLPAPLCPSNTKI